MSIRVKAAVVMLCMTFVALAMAKPASATTILTFGQSTPGSPVTGTSNGTTTTITATNTLINIDSIDPASGLSTPILNVYFNLSATSTGPAFIVGGNVLQSYAGSFSITSLSGGGGINYLSGVFTDAIFGAGASLTMSASQPPGALTYTSSAIPTLGLPRGFSLGFANVNPLAGTNGTTLNSFTSSVAGTFSATAVPEPASLLLIGSGLVGLAAAQRRRLARKAK